VTVRIGLTGPIGCGKSTIAGWLAKAGAMVVDADELARAVVEPGEPGFDAVVEAFGEEVVAAGGGLDRAALAAIVFADPAELRRLEAIVHPAVRPRIIAAVATAEAAAAPAVVIEAIKLVEGGYADQCDEVWLVDCDAAAQRGRLRARGLSEADAEGRLATQAGLAERLRPAASRVIDTSGPIGETRRRVLEAFEAAVAAAPG
jgi:dephospho-CoA kinase